jgi:hypothetical protein
MPAVANLLLEEDGKTFAGSDYRALGDHPHCDMLSLRTRFQTRHIGQPDCWQD